jgi:hypothetical protein
MMGKFANGAQTGAFRYLFNESMRHGRMFNDLKNNNIAENSKCGNAPVSCIATSTGGIGKYQDGNKLARYNCSNSGGNCSFVAQGDGEHVYGAKLGTSWHPDYGTFTRAYGVEDFIVDPNDTLQIPKRPRLCPVCEFTATNHRDGATNNCLSSSID